MKKALSVIAIVMIVAMLGIMMAACAPKDTDAAKSKLEKAGYEVTVLGNSVIAYKGDEYVTAYLCESKNKAKAYATTFNDMLGDEDDEIKVIGKWAVIGTKAGVKAFK